MFMPRGGTDDRKIEARKTPRQRRSNHTVAAILEAAVLVLKSDGMKGFNTNAIAERAGVSIGSLYQYFPTKEAIVVSLIRKMRAEMLETMKAAMQQASTGVIRHDARVFIKAAISHHLMHAGTVEILERMEAELPLDRETADLKIEMHQLVVEVLERAGIATAENVAADLVAICGALSRTLPASGISCPEEMSNRMLRAVVGYIEFREISAPQ
jgi:AcrR family transcriptional regulator